MRQSTSMWPKSSSSKPPVLPQTPVVSLFSISSADVGHRSGNGGAGFGPRTTKPCKYLLLVPLIVVFLFCFLSACSKQPSATQAQEFTFAVDSYTMASAPVFVAEAKGFWKKYNLNVEIKPFASGRLALDALVGKAADAATAADIPVVLAAFRQPKVRVIGTFSNSEKHVNMLGRKDRGVSKPQDLKGKRVALPLGTAAEFVMDKFLEKSAISRSEVKVVALAPPDTVAAIIRGDVDAIFTWQPFIYGAQKQLRDNAVVFSSEGIYNQPFSVVVMADDALAEKRAPLKKLIQGLNDAESFIKTNRAEAIEIVAKKIGVDRKDVEAVWSGYSFEMGLDSSLVKLLESEGTWAKKAGIVKEDTSGPDYQALVFRELLINLK